MLESFGADLSYIALGAGLLAAGVFGIIRDSRVLAVWP